MAPHIETFGSSSSHPVLGDPKRLSHWCFDGLLVHPFATGHYLILIYIDHVRNSIHFNSKYVLTWFACSIPSGWAAEILSCSDPASNTAGEKSSAEEEVAHFGGGMSSASGEVNILVVKNATCFGGGRTMEESELFETSWVLKLVSQLMSVLLGWFCDDGPESWAFHSELRLTKPFKTSVGAQILCNRS
jgi:hypothetical protein